MMSKYIMLLLAIFNTVCEMGPQYIVNFTDWIKTALWNAPFRVFLDIELELLRLNRRLDPDSESDEEIMLLIHLWVRFNKTNHTKLIRIKI